jgi:hypothetical protein
MDAEEYGMRLTLETAARLAQASRVIKQAADQEREGRTSQKRRPLDANEALRPSSDVLECVVQRN